MERGDFIGAFESCANNSMVLITSIGSWVYPRGASTLLKRLPSEEFYLNSVETEWTVDVVKGDETRANKYN